MKIGELLEIFISFVHYDFVSVYPQMKHQSQCDSFDFDPEIQLGSDKPCNCGLDILKINSSYGKK